METKLTGSLVVCIAATIAFNVLPIVVGFGSLLIVCFALYACLVLCLSIMDRRVLGYATILTACNVANGEKVSFSFMVALLAVIKESGYLERVTKEMVSGRWWLAFMAAFLLSALSCPFWFSSAFGFLTELKAVVSHLGYLVVAPIAIALTLRRASDAVTVVSILCIMYIAVLAMFYFFGNTGSSSIVGSDGSQNVVEVFRTIGRASVSFNRTQVCIPLAVLGSAMFALAVCAGAHGRAIAYYSAYAVCVYMILMLGSVGSAISLFCGMAVVSLAYTGVRIDVVRLLYGTVVFGVMCAGLYWAVFKTDNYLSERIEERATLGIEDRAERWRNGIVLVSITPIGHGMVDSSIGHSEYFTYLLSYGWPTGFCYMAGIGGLYVRIWRTLRRSVSADRQARTAAICCLASATVYIVNAVSDMPSGSIVNFQAIWAVILTPATIATTIGLGLAGVGKVRVSRSTMVS